MEDAEFGRAKEVKGEAFEDLLDGTEIWKNGKEDTYTYGSRLQ